jgi:hypothetical protein
MPWARLAGNHRTDVNDVCRPLRLGGWPKIPNRALLPDFSFHTHFGLDGVELSLTPNFFTEPGTPQKRDSRLPKRCYDGCLTRNPVLPW